MSSTRGQSETVGFALLLVLTIISVGALATFGSVALDSAQERIGVQSAEHAMSQFDSRVAMVGLGRSDVQTIDFGQSQKGTYTVEPGTGRMIIHHYNYSAGNDEEIYNETLGSVVYKNGETEIAYQGGGVWRLDSGASMISPPEFHYRGATLTLPVLQVDGDGSVSGNPKATIRQTRANKRIYPNQSQTYDGTLPYQNPIGSGNIEITVQSKYYEAWAEYFRTRTSGNVTVDHQNESATMELIALGTYGDFNMPLDGNSMTLRGLRSHQIDDFNITLFADDDDNADFSNLDWSLYASTGSKEFEINIVKITGSVSHNDPVKVTMYYSPNNGVDYQGWVANSSYHFETEAGADTDWNNDNDKDDERLVLNFSTQDEFYYTNVKKGGGGDDEGSTLEFDANDRLLPGTFDEHESNIGWEPKSYTDGDTEHARNLTNHYFALMGPTMDLYVQDPNKDTVEESTSYGRVTYTGESDFFLTYLHVTENEVNITVR